MMEIILDTREPEDIYLLLKSRGLEVKRQPLPAGDFLVGGFLIERKTLNDFYSSIIDKRLWKQLEALKQQDADKTVVIIGSFEDLKKVPPHRSIKIVMSVVSTIIASFKIPVLFLRDESMLLELITSLVKIYSETKPSLRPVVKRKAKNDFEVLENVLCQFPRIGLQKARVLLKAYGSLQNLFADETIRVPALKRELENLRRISRLQYQEET